jgi:hypothetical protein
LNLQTLGQTANMLTITWLRWLSSIILRCMGLTSVFYLIGEN